MKLTTRGPKVAQAIADRQEFTTHGALRGETHTPGRYVYEGQLPANQGDPSEAEYIVWSYATPIAWYGNGEWTIPNVKYSITTSKHQGKLYMTPGSYVGNDAKRAPSSTGGGWGG